MDNCTEPVAVKVLAFLFTYNSTTKKRLVSVVKKESFNLLWLLHLLLLTRVIIYQIFGK